MKHEDKITWMMQWCMKNKFQLELEGECGFGRECVGIISNGQYPDYTWHNQDTWEREDNNGDVWVPEDAYHKHDCVAVLGRGEEAESQLYDWLKWFDDNNFKLDVSYNNMSGIVDPIIMIFGKHINVRMVKQ